MALCAVEDGVEGKLCVAPGARRGNAIWRRTEVEAQYPMMAELRAMYADLQSLPVPDRLLQLVQEFEIKQRALRHDA